MDDDWVDKLRCSENRTRVISSVVGEMHGAISRSSNIEGFCEDEQEDGEDRSARVCSPTKAWKCISDLGSEKSCSGGHGGYRSYRMCK